MVCHVYILKSEKKGCLYTGSTGNLEKRIESHNLGLSRYTSSRRPWVLVYKEEFHSRSEAVKREKFFKTGKGREFLKEIIK